MKYLKICIFRCAVSAGNWRWYHVVYDVSTACILHLLIQFIRLLQSMRNLYIMHHAGNKTPQHIW